MQPSCGSSDVEFDALRELDDHPEGMIAAIGAGGLVVPMPASVHVPESRIVHVRSMVQIVAPEDRATAIEAYDLAQSIGLARTVVHLASTSRPLVHLAITDARAEHGVFLAVVVAQVGSGADLQLGGLAPAPPRLARTRKTGTGTLTSVDEAFVSMFGWPADQAVGRRALDFVHPDDHEVATDSYVQMLAAPGQSYRARLRHLCSDGTWKWVEITNTNLLDVPDAAYVAAEMLDISDEMAALEALQAREQLLHRLAEALPTGVLQVDRDGTVVYANTRIGQVLGGPSGPTAAARFAAVTDTDRVRLEAALAEVLRRGADRDLEVAVATASGVQRCCQVAIRALTANDESVTGAVICATDVTDSARLRTELEWQATTDLPTACRNRNWVMTRLGELVESRDDLAVIFVDLDDFKMVNDRFGHAAGDEVLVAVAARLRHAVRGCDVVGRVGGDEFLVICPNTGGPENARRLAERVAYAVDQHDPMRDGLCLPGASVGMAYRGDRDVTADQLVAEADAAMYAAKSIRHRDRRRAG